MRIVIRISRFVGAPPTAGERAPGPSRGQMFTRSSREYTPARKADTSSDIRCSIRLCGKANAPRGPDPPAPGRLIDQMVSSSSLHASMCSSTSSSLAPLAAPSPPASAAAASSSPPPMRWKPSSIAWIAVATRCASSRESPSAAAAIVASPRAGPRSPVMTLCQKLNSSCSDRLDAYCPCFDQLAPDAAAPLPSAAAACAGPVSVRAATALVILDASDANGAFAPASPHSISGRYTACSDEVSVFSGEPAMWWMWNMSGGARRPPPAGESVFFSRSTT